MPIELTICTGQTCQRLSSKELLAAARKLAREHPGCLRVETRHCFARCQVNDGEICPSVLLNGEWLKPGTTATALKRRLRPLIAKLEAEINDPDDPFGKLLRSL